MNTYQLRRRPLAREPRRVPLLVRGAVVPEGAAKVVQGEEELLGAVLIEAAKDAVVADEGLELAAERVALDPVCCK